MKADEMRKLLHRIIDGDVLQSTITRHNKPLKDADHPTMKPVMLIAESVRNSTKPREIVLDLFGGSGTTLIACEQLNRQCRIMEYDPQYADVILARWEKLTERKAIKITE